MALFKKEKECEHCRQSVGKKEGCVIDTTPDLAGQPREVKEYLKENYGEGSRIHLCKDCSARELERYIAEFENRLVFVRNDTKKYNAQTFYALAYLDLFEEESGSFSAEIRGFMDSEKATCDSCDAPTQFYAVGLDFFENNDPFAWKISKEPFNVAHLCKKCFRKSVLNTMDIPLDVYPPLNIGDGIWTPWEV